MYSDVVIVGAGAAGVGMAATLKDFGIEDFLLLDRHEVGASFMRWPAEMRLITPSFNTTPFGMLDLNAVALNTSVANVLENEHPTGKEYARYLEAVLQAKKISVESKREIIRVERNPAGGFRLKESDGHLECRFLIWAAGEFQFPRLNHFLGAELCIHNSLISSYNDLDGDGFIIIGAFESGVDAMVHLAELGKSATLLCAEEELALSDQDPSRSLSPFTRQRLKSALAKHSNLRIRYGCRVEEVKQSDQEFIVHTQQGEKFSSSTQPILGTGFHGGTGPVEHLFDYRDDKQILLSEEDESTRADGLFLAGPLVRHDHHIFCYIYKFRQRFAVIAETIAERLGKPVPDDLLQTYECNQMRLTDLSNYGKHCIC